jgi:hypothetical protein
LIPVATVAAILIVAGVFVWNLGGVRDQLLNHPGFSQIRSLAVLPLANSPGMPARTTSLMG